MSQGSAHAPAPGIISRVSVCYPFGAVHPWRINKAGIYSTKYSVYTADLITSATGRGTAVEPQILVTFHVYHWPLFRHSRHRSILWSNAPQLLTSWPMTPFHHQPTL